MTSIQVTGSTAVDPSTNSFAALRLSEASVQALAKLGIDTPTPIQASAIPALLQGRDLIGQARTGSGKTLAFVLPGLERIDPQQRAVQMMVLTPTRELALQIGGVVGAIAGRHGVRQVLVVGGRSMGPQKAAIQQGAQVLIGTPGRVLDLVRQRVLRLGQLRFLVLDEADNLLDNGFGPDVARIIDQTSARRQTALFSATMPEWVEDAAAKYLDDPVVAAVDPRPQDSAPVEHHAFDVPGGDKQRALRELLDNRPGGSTIVFGRTKHGVKKLARSLQREGYPVAALQGNLSQSARERVMRDFRSGRVDILVATNVAARGLDISTVDLVINIELPESPELLTHRIGRTGRVGRQGLAVTLLAPADARKWRQLMREAGMEIAHGDWPGAERALSGDFAPGVAPGGNRHRPLDSARAATRRGAGNGHSARNAGSAKRHEIVCQGCGRPDTVPFKPTGSRPVYCRDCFTPRRRDRKAA